MKQYDSKHNEGLYRHANNCLRNNKNNTHGNHRKQNLPKKVVFEQAMPNKTYLEQCECQRKEHL